MSTSKETSAPSSAHTTRRAFLGIILAGVAVFVALGVLAARYPTATATRTVSNAAANTTSIPDQGANLAEIQGSAETLRKVALGRPVAVEHVDRAQVGALVGRLIAAGRDARRVGATDEALHLLGALTADQHLQTLQTDGLASQVAGLYDPSTKRLYVVDGGTAPATDSTLVHEVVHALQDSRYDLQGTILQPRPFDADAESAAQAVAEGDATEVQQRFLASQGLAGLIGELGGSLGQLAEVPAEQRQLPPFLQRSLEFPYIQGAAFVKRLRASGGERAVDRAFRNPPKSTLAILVPERYLAGDPSPIRVELPRPDRGARRVLATTFGAADLLALGVDDGVARTWRGGQIALDRRGGVRTLHLALATTRPRDLAVAVRRVLPGGAVVRADRASVAVRIAR